MPRSIFSFIRDFLAARVNGTSPHLEGLLRGLAFAAALALLVLPLAVAARCERAAVVAARVSEDQSRSRGCPIGPRPVCYAAWP